MLVTDRTSRPGARSDVVAQRSGSSVAFEFTSFLIVTAGGGGQARPDQVLHLLIGASRRVQRRIFRHGDGDSERMVGQADGSVVDPYTSSERITGCRLIQPFQVFHADQPTASHGYGGWRTDTVERASGA
jgi:hypothetical protein